MIEAKIIAREMENALIKANTVFEPELATFLEKYDGPFSSVLKNNIEESSCTGLPICQDTGMIEFFILAGHKVSFDEPIELTLTNVVKKVYTENPYRYTVVTDPLFNRRNTGNNTPPIFHFIQTKGNKLEIRFLVKGGGSENLSKLFMLKPSATEEELVSVIVEAVKESGARGCPPLKVGMGIGGTSDKAMMMAKLALTRSINERNPDPNYEKLETRLLNEINNLKIGYQGLGTGISAYSVNIEYYPTHIATLPVALAADCYISRRGRISLED